MFVKIKCPACQTEGSLSLVESSYEGPYKCWKCRQLFTIVLEDDEVKSCEPLSEEEFQKQQEIKAMQDKLKRQFPGREESG
jgi:C4-type Zn-finger protein